MSKIQDKMLTKIKDGAIVHHHCYHHHHHHQSITIIRTANTATIAINTALVQLIFVISGLALLPGQQRTAASSSPYTVDDGCHPCL